MFPKREMNVVAKMFDMTCPSDSYSTKKEFKQIVGDRELYNKYVKYVLKHNELQLLKDENYVEVSIRCYNVFMEWKKQYKVRKMTQGDIDYNCNYCFDFWKVERELIELKEKIEHKERKMEKENNEDDKNDLRNEIEKIKKELKEQEEKFRNLEKHKKLIKIQRERLEQLEQNLIDNEILVFFDYTKYNYLCHDLCFVVLYKENNQTLSIFIFYMQSGKMEKKQKMMEGIQLPLSNYFLKDLESQDWEKKVIYLGSDGGAHFICAPFIDHLTRLAIEEWNKLAPHHGGNYCDGEFGVCKCSLRLYEQEFGQQKTVEDIMKVLQVKDRDAEFYLIEEIQKELNYTYMSSPFPNGIKG